MSRKIFCTSEQLAYADRCVALMNEIIDADIMERSRIHLQAWGRFMVGSLLRDHGWTTVAIGEYFGYNHTAVTHWLQSVETMKANPTYGVERQIYNTLIESIEKYGTRESL